MVRGLVSGRSPASELWSTLGGERVLTLAVVVRTEARLDHGRHATEVPTIDVAHFESPSPFTAFGVKGAGEAGVIGAAAVVVGAVEDALARAGRPIAELDATPVRPNVVWERLGSR